MAPFNLHYSPARQKSFPALITGLHCQGRMREWRTAPLSHCKLEVMFAISWGVGRGHMLHPLNWLLQKRHAVNPQITRIIHRFRAWVWLVVAWYGSIYPDPFWLLHWHRGNVTIHIGASKLVYTWPKFRPKRRVVDTYHIESVVIYTRNISWAAVDWSQITYTCATGDLLQK